MSSDTKTSGTTFPVEPTRLVNTDKLKAEIAAALPLSAVVERLCDVELQSAGHQRKGNCPLHEEDTPSFFVNDAKGLWHCFGCKEGGDSIEIVRRVHHVGYREALVLMAAEADIDIKAYERPATPEEKVKDELRRWCENWLNLEVENQDGRASDEICAGFGVGVRVTAGMPPPYLKDKAYWLRGTIFPYRTVTGRLVGWKSRHPDKKMFGTPVDFPLAEPVIYGFDVARPHVVGGQLVVVEGEYDTLALHEYGVRNVGGIGGSAWTDEQMAIVEDAQIRDLVFLLDGDEGGRTAAAQIAKRYWNHPKIRVRIALSWPGADPEDMVRMLGAVAITGLVNGAKGALEWLLWSEYESQPRQSLTAKLDFVRWVQTEYGGQLAGLREDLVLREVAGWLGVPEADVLDFAQANKTMLQATDSEKVVIARAIRDQKYYVALRKRMGADDFYMQRHKRLWNVLAEMLADGLDFDAATVRRRAEAQGIDAAYVDILFETGDVNIGWHEEQVIDFSVRRSARADADRFREIIGDLSVPANQLIGTLTHAVTSKALGRGSGAFVDVSTQADEAMEKLHERARNPGQVSGIDLGSQFPTLTSNLDGLQSRRLVLVAAPSGKGKSTFTLQICTISAVIQSIPTDFISLEMDYDEILFKICSHLTGIDSLKISKGALDPSELARVEQAMARIARSPLRIYTPDGITPNEFLLYARESVMERRTEIFAIDYAQMVGPDPDTQRLSRYEQLGKFAYTAKLKIARGLDCTVIACAQLKREAAGKEEPTPEDMGDSYELVRAADVILLLNEPDDSANEVWIGKNRQGPGQVLVPADFDKPNNTFREAVGAKVPDYRVI